MRLSEREQQAIREIVRREDPSAEIYLFGSRLDDDRKGGDIDLYLEIGKAILPNTLQRKIRPCRPARGSQKQGRGAYRNAASKREKNRSGNGSLVRVPWRMPVTRPCARLSTPPSPSHSSSTSCPAGGGSSVMSVIDQSP